MWNLFGKKSRLKNITPELASVWAGKIETIPEEFYGGKNPVINFKNVAQEVALPSSAPISTAEKLKPADKKALDKQSAAGAGRPYHPANLLTNYKFMLAMAVGLFAVFAAGAGLYYYLTLRPAKPAPAAPPVLTPPVSQATSTPTSTIIETTTSTVPISESPTATPALVINFPSRLTARPPDLDNDGLSDAEEEIFSTDLGAPDTDADSYSDGHEVFYLYNPAGFAPVKLIDSGLVKNYFNPAFGYEVYYPKNWVAGAVDRDYRGVLFTALNGQGLAVETFDLPAGGFAQWFDELSSRSNQRYDDLEKFTSRFEEIGLRRQDKLVYYFADSQRVYVLTYQTGPDAGVADYPQILEMAARSFRLRGNSVELPLPLRSEDATSTGSGVDEFSAPPAVNGSAI